MVDLHRRGRTDRLMAAWAIGVGLAAIAAGSLGLVIDGPFWAYLLVFLWIVGGFILLVGAVLLTLSFRPFHIAFDESGLTVHCEGLRLQAPWTKVEAINIERMMTEEERYMFVVWLTPDVPMRERPTFSAGGPKGYAVVELNQIIESRLEIMAILHKYAGPKVRSAT